MPKGLIASIYKSRGQSCSNGGISTYFEEVLVVGDDIPNIFEAKGRPVVKLQKGAFDGQVVAVVLQKDGTVKDGRMFGGCYISTSDSRFSQAVRKIAGFDFYGAVPLHDRYEW